MTIINGIYMKNLEEFQDHEDMAIYRRDVYLNKTKTASWSQSF